MGAYLVFLSLGRKWRKEYETKGEKYWTEPKEKRVKELTSDVWRPKLVAISYFMAYFSNGFMKMAYSLWVPLFLINRGVSVFDAALFIGLSYVSWQWKMFIGMASDSLKVKFRGKSHRRHPWFLIAGLLGVVGSMIFVFADPADMPVWTLFFPITVMIIAGSAIFDLAADAYALDVVPPEFHARILGGVQTAGMAVGGIAGSMIPPLLINMWGYRSVLIVGGFTCALAFPFLLQPEPKLEQERIFGKQAIAFTFTEKTVLIASLLMMGNAIGIIRIISPTGGMFSLIMNNVVGDMTPELAGNIATISLLVGIPSSLIGGWAADKWGHKRVYYITGAAAALTGYLWVTLQPGMVVWFIVLASFSNFLQRLSTGGRMALMGDATPLALSATVYQMYMSFSWIGNVPCSVIVGWLLPINLPLLMVLLSTLSFIPVVIAKWLKPFEAAKATKV